MDGWKISFLLVYGAGRCYVSFREGICWLIYRLEYVFYWSKFSIDLSLACNQCTSLTTFTNKKKIRKPDNSAIVTPFGMVKTDLKTLPFERLYSSLESDLQLWGLVRWVMAWLSWENDTPILNFDEFWRYDTLTLTNPKVYRTKQQFN